MYQLRFKAYLLHTGLAPEHVKNHQFVTWIQAKWGEFERISGARRPYTMHDHKQFNRWLMETAPEGQLMF